ETVRSPVVLVTGTVVASMRQGKNGKNGKNDFWQFNAPEMLSTYADWQKAIKDVTFYTEQLDKRRKANRAIEAAQRGVVKRKKDLLRAGTETSEVVAAAEADLEKLVLTNEKEEHEANNAILVAQRTEAALARQLQQAGLDPEILREADPNYDVVMADVPEHRLNQIRVGQACEARFFGLPGEVFSGRVRSISPVVSKERRTLRVLFQVRDPEDQLRPGMFAEIGLGTSPRNVLLIPTAAVVHVGREDYALVKAKNGNRNWRVAQLRLGETYGNDAEVVEGFPAMMAAAVLAGGSGNLLP